MTGSRTRCAAALAAVLLVMSAFAAPARGDDIVDDVTPTSEPDESTTTTAPPEDEEPPTTTTEPEPEPDPEPPEPPAPVEGDLPPDGGEGGEGDVDPSPAPRVVPPEAQATINAVARSAPNSSAELLAAIQPLVDLGLSKEEAIRVGFGSFPIAGEARFTHDWLYPRWGASGFRHHLGTDVFAAYGTPLRAITDGTLRASSGGLGGLSVRVTMPDGTYFYYAHLSALVEGYQEGMAVQRGDIIGYVGDSGNARGGSPHLHLGIYLANGQAIDPKPYLDDWLAEAMQELPAIIESVRAAAANAPARSARIPRALISSELLSGVSDRSAAGEVSTEVLYTASGNSSAGGMAVAESQARNLAAAIDWHARALPPDSDALALDDDQIQLLLELTAGALNGLPASTEHAGG